MLAKKKKLNSCNNSNDFVKGNRLRLATSIKNKLNFFARAKNLLADSLRLSNIYLYICMSIYFKCDKGLNARSPPLCALVFMDNYLEIAIARDA